MYILSNVVNMGCCYLKSRHYKLEMSRIWLSSVQSLNCLTLCNPMDWSTPGFPVHHQLPKLAQTHVHWVGDAIQTSYPLSSPSIFPSIRVFSSEFILASGGQTFGASVSASVVPVNIQGWFPSRLICLISLLPLKILPQHHSSKANFNEGVFVINVD